MPKTRLGYKVKKVLSMENITRTEHLLTLSCGHTAVIVDGVKRGQKRQTPKRYRCFKCAHAPQESDLG